MCKFRALQSKTEGMAASVRVFLEHPSYIGDTNNISVLASKKDITYGMLGNLNLLMLSYADFFPKTSHLKKKKKDQKYIRVSNSLDHIIFLTLILKVMCKGH